MIIRGPRRDLSPSAQTPAARSASRTQSTLWDIFRQIVKRPEKNQANATHWSTGSLAVATGMRRGNGSPASAVLARERTAGRRRANHAS
jgi:hypothetical protein